jgi:hypothetical protein
MRTHGYASNPDASPKNIHEFGLLGSVLNATRNGRVQTFSDIDTKDRSLTVSDTRVTANMVIIDATR